MPIILHATREVQLKIVYYGPAKSGKTTNLQQIHAQVQTGAVEDKSKLLTLATGSDRTLFFDFLPIQAPTIRGYKTKFQLYTVPGQVIYGITRQLVLRGVDGIVFVADSQYEMMPENVESFAEMERNLRTLKLSLGDVPCVLQYNNQDLANAAPKEYLDFALNDRDVRVPAFLAVASGCQGVFETLNAIARLLVTKYVLNAEKQPSAHAFVPPTA